MKVWVWREPFAGGLARTTDAQGRVLADRLPPARYRLQAMITGRPMLDLGIVAVGPGEHRDLGRIVVADPGTVVLDLFAADGSRGAATAAWLEDLTGKWAGAFADTPDGVRSGPVAAGDYRVVAFGAEVPLTRSDVAVRAGETTRLRIDLVPGFRRRIVFVRPPDHPDLDLDVTVADADGRVLCAGIGGRWPGGRPAELDRSFAPGSYTITAVDAQHGLRGEQAFAIDAGAPAEGRVEVRLK